MYAGLLKLYQEATRNIIQLVITVYAVNTGSTVRKIFLNSK